MPGCTLFLAIGIGLLVVAVDVEHAVPYSAVNETEDGDRAQHQHDRVRPSIADAQHVIGVHSHRYADQDCRYTAHDADHQQARLAAVILLGVEILDIRMAAFELGVRHAARDQHRQPGDHTYADAQEREEVIEPRHAEDGVA